MIALDDSLISSSTRPLRLVMRPDLAVREHRYQGERSWVVKDPLGLKYFRLRREEYAILKLLDGRSSLDDLKEQYEADFSPRKITHDELAHFVGNLHQNGLVHSLLPNQGTQLKQRRDERRKEEFVSTLTNLLSLRFRGVDPQRLLDWLLPYTSWFFTPLAAAAALLLGLSAVTLILVQFEAFHARLPGSHEFFAAGNWIYLAAAMAVTKVLHELGHGLSCRKYGGECHEIGLMMLVMTPCLYCDVSDSWMVKSKWQRATIGAAGMYVELVIAALATFVWWFSVPGLLNNLMLSVMFVCSVSTVVFNGNPLLRYDGYYILADLLEIPNLRQKAGSVVTHKLGAWLLGLEEPEDRYLPRRGQAWFALYAVTSVVYRWMVVGGVVFFLCHVLKPYGLEIIGQMLGGLAVVGLVAQPLWGLKRFLSVPGQLEKIHLPRVALTLGLVVMALLFALAIPLPHRVYCALEVQPHEAAQVFVEVPGVLREVKVRAGDHVEAGDVLATLENLDSRLEIAKLSGECDEDEAKLNMLQHLRHLHNASSKEAESQIAELEKSLASVRERLAERQRDLGHLTLRSPRSGIVLPPPMVKATAKSEEGLVAWSGTPLDRQNLGTWLNTGSQACYIGNPKQLEAVLVIDQADIQFIHEGQEVALLLDSMAGRSIVGKVAAISQAELKTSSQRMSTKHGGQLDTRSDPETGQERPASPSYQASVVLDNSDHVLRLSLKGEARVQVGTETLGRKLWRFLSRTFYFNL
ncbi:MAG: HlyD family efflux transporter periplasmic adaptor subunit [Planctomycetia bacterium]|nr:HlyD family efflux transporter periplasmic adaptor subunit [Planctomycetia bacterium]